MKVNVNNKPVDTSSTTLHQLIAELSLPAAGIAVGIDGHLVKRPLWEQTLLQDGANIVVVKAACGG